MQSAFLVISIIHLSGNSYHNIGFWINKLEILIAVDNKISKYKSTVQIFQHQRFILNQCKKNWNILSNTSKTINIKSTNFIFFTDHANIYGFDKTSSSTTFMFQNCFKTVHSTLFKKKQLTFSQLLLQKYIFNDFWRLFHPTSLLTSISFDSFNLTICKQWEHKMLQLWQPRHTAVFCFHKNSSSSHYPSCAVLYCLLILALFLSSLSFFGDALRFLWI